MDRHRRFEPGNEDDLFDDADHTEGVHHEVPRPLVACPYCREVVFQEAQYCPRCENDISTEDRGGGSPKPLWIWVCLVLALAASLVAAVR